MLGLTVLVGAIAGVYGSSIKVDTDLRRLLPESAPSVRALDMLESRKGSSEGFVIAIEAKDKQFDVETAKGLLSTLGGTNIDVVED